MPTIGWFEILIIVGIAIVVLGPKDFPIMLKKAGSWIGTAKKYMRDIQSEVSNIDIEEENTNEIILALPATMEGDTTNFYIYRKLQDIQLNITLISRGIGVGNQLEYIDELTLGKSLLDRSVYKNKI